MRKLVEISGRYAQYDVATVGFVSGNFTIGVKFHGSAVSKAQRTMEKAPAGSPELDFSSARQVAFRMLESLISQELRQRPLDSEKRPNYLWTKRETTHSNAGTFRGDCQRKHSMCIKGLEHEFAGSRGRWYDFPAVMLGQQAIRCQNCEQRFFVTRFGSGKKARIHRLWKHYALCSVLFLAIGTSSYAWMNTTRVQHVVNKPLPVVEEKVNQTAVPADSH